MSWRDTSNLFIAINSPGPDIVAAGTSPSGVISGPTGEGDMGEGDEQAHQLKGLTGYVLHITSGDPHGNNVPIRKRG